ncbi:protein gustavus-like [Mercenaria mercenaria]|uniref:protein gustavus-like n=1 Tax=Mercenaria mercenaria TaxID=6596 RepID=UPI00234E804E|nr:protein gustavus-like [Mercenaria mercenaria]
MMYFSVEDGTSITEDSGSSQMFVVGGILLLICLAFLMVLCADEVQHTADLPPAWTNIVQIDNAINTGFKGVSDGMRIVDPNCVQRTRTGDYEADGARWGAPLKKGKHLFEIHWPRTTRRLLATVGVGTKDAPLFVKPKDSLVGCNKYTWGLDIARYRCLHRDEMIAVMPRNKLVPDTFLMYVDCDSGTLGFGTEYAYWGAPIHIPKSEFPVFPMVGTTQHMAQITMKYKGSAVDTVGDTGYNQPAQVVVTNTGPPANQGQGQQSETYVAPMIVSGV